MLALALVLPDATTEDPEADRESVGFPTLWWSPHIQFTRFAYLFSLPLLEIFVFLLSLIFCVQIGFHL